MRAWTRWPCESREGDLFKRYLEAGSVGLDDKLEMVGENPFSIPIAPASLILLSFLEIFPCFPVPLGQSPDSLVRCWAVCPSLCTD